MSHSSATKIDWIAALPMYDWPEVRAEVDSDWAAIRDRLRAQGVEAPEGLTRHSGDMPAVPGGIRDGEGRVIAPDPATLPPDELDVQTLWRHPKLLFAQTCWGPMELGLQEHVRVVAQPDYTAFDGGQGELYSSAVLMRRGDAAGREPPDNGRAVLPLEAMRGARLAYNSQDSMSGLIALTRDLDAVCQSLALFGERVETGSHRASAVAVAEGRAEVCAVDCRSWHLIGRFEPKAADLVVAGWTARRKGLPYVCSRKAPTFELAIGTGG